MKPDVLLEKTFSVEIENGIVRAVFLNPENDKADNIRRAELITHAAYEIYDRHKGEKFNVLVDTRSLDNKTENLPDETRDIYNKFANHEQTNKIAVLGASIQTVVIRFVSWFVESLKHVRWFDDEKKALDWLSE